MAGAGIISALIMQFLHVCLRGEDLDFPARFNLEASAKTANGATHITVPRCNAQIYTISAVFEQAYDYGYHGDALSYL